MTSRPPAPTRAPAGPGPPGASAGVSSRPPPRPPGPPRSLSAHHTSLAASSNAAARNVAVDGAMLRKPGLVIDLTAGDGDSGRPKSADGGKLDVATNSTPATSPSAASAEACSRTPITRRGRPSMRFIDTRTIDEHRSASAPANMAESLPFPTRPGQQANSKALQLQQAIQTVQQSSRRKATGISGTVTFEPPSDARKYPHSSTFHTIPATLPLTCSSRTRRLLSLDWRRSHRSSYAKPHQDRSCFHTTRSRPRLEYSSSIPVVQPQEQDWIRWPAHSFIAFVLRARAPTTTGQAQCTFDFQTSSQSCPDR